MRLHRLTARNRDVRQLLDEQAARERLGYQPRADHPWSRPLNQPDPQLCEGSGIQGEREFDGAAELTG